jgi:hypothetical protein
MMDLEGNEVDVPGAIDNRFSYRYLGDMKFLPSVNDLFDNPPRQIRGGVSM